MKYKLSPCFMIPILIDYVSTELFLLEFKSIWNATASYQMCYADPSVWGILLYACTCSNWTLPQIGCHKPHLRVSDGRQHHCANRTVSTGLWAGILRCYPASSGICQPLFSRNTQLALYFWNLTLWRCSSASTISPI